MPGLVDAESEAVRVGVIGCGEISEEYFRAGYPDVSYVACADIDLSRAEATAKAHGLRAMSPADLLADPGIDVVCNLTVPKAHAAISRAAVDAGKHVYQEKPLGLDRAEAASLLEAAHQREVLVGCAPDTFLGAGLQTSRRAIDDGRIGTPVSAMGFMVNHGHENWHPNPGFYYQRGGGPLFDMGPYYLTALVALLGPIARVAAMSYGEGGERMLREGTRSGDVLQVEVPTHVAGVLDFLDGTIATMVMSFDVWASRLPLLEIHGTEGSLSLPDPNDFGGPVRLYPAGAQEWEEIATDHFVLHRRGVGLADLARVIREGGVHRASGQLAYHVLDAMVALDESGKAGGHVQLDSSVERPQQMPQVASI